ncbi:Hypp4265 [Branchiostoma lanceolatum]|uniref:Hypp4265 protein n=1 Tax=Branchiostoma lanceolatum TaxID=7740 RepID=A0A8K0A9M6_BRALA|nr:Hypp4265 [Branchiostoma lanceolatum]
MVSCTVESSIVRNSKIGGTLTPNCRWIPYETHGDCCIPVRSMCRGGGVDVTEEEEHGVVTTASSAHPISGSIDGM